MRNLLGRAEEYLMAGLLAFMTIMTFSQVVMRYVFNTGVVWSLEATTYAFGWLVVVGMAHGMREGGHLAVDLMVAKLSPGLRRIAVLAAILLCLVYAGLMGYGATVLVERLMDLGNDARDLPVQRWLLVIVMPVGFALLGLRLIGLAIEVWRGERNTLGDEREGR